VGLTIGALTGVIAWAMLSVMEMPKPASDITELKDAPSPSLQPATHFSPKPVQ